MHHAKDTEFYLRKGFRVMALEANPHLVEVAEAKHADFVRSGQLAIEPKALWEADDSTVDFYLNADMDDWSSVLKTWAEKGGHPSSKISVPSITLPRLYDRYGIPYYVKCDIEGADRVFCEQLLGDGRRPAFVSIEAISTEVIALLYAAGYNRFQIVNQALNSMKRPPSPATEGQYVDVAFDGHMSGLFGRELPADKWRTFAEIVDNYSRFIDMQRRDPDLAFGWLDIHAMYRADVAAG